MLTTGPIPKRVAQPGDIFVLLVPDEDELNALEAWQTRLQTRYGGIPVQPIHITVERFSPEDGLSFTDCATELSTTLSQQKPFQLYTDCLIQFFAPYWQSPVLRWRVQDSPVWDQFRDQLEAALHKISCPSHFERRRHATCTALTLEQPVDLAQNAPATIFPAHLFTVRKILISMLEAPGKFNILTEINLTT